MPFPKLSRLVVCICLLQLLMPVSALHAGLAEQVVTGVQTVIRRLTGGEEAKLTSDKLRVAVYNIAYGRGNDRGGLNEVGGKPQNLLRAAWLLKDQKFDIAGCTEVSAADLRGGMSDQPSLIAMHSGLNYRVYGENHRFGLIVIGMGNAVFSRFPIAWSKNHKLYRAKEENEQRGCLEALIDLGEKGKVRVFVTHLSLNADESNLQLQQIYKIIKSRPEPSILMGDFNSHPGSANINFLNQNMTDVSDDSGGTYWPKVFQNKGVPAEKLDYIFVHGSLKKDGASWISGFKEGISDHGCLGVVLQLP
ncbi:MAG TPA: hypothetical protein DCG57_10215 [Candidatus Riflebacteria bacterium]|nr:hypothetical protein [Candidatus Riflebacteria bacterium]